MDIGQNKLYSISGKHPDGVTVSDPGIGHSDIRGFGLLFTDRSMVRRERHRLKAWIRKREGSVFELFSFDTDRKKTSYWFILQSITYNRENHELLISAKDMEINQKPEDAVPFKDSLNPMTKGAARSIYLESGNKIVFRG